jgi:hypothetical protein
MADNTRFLTNKTIYEHMDRNPEQYLRVFQGDTKKYKSEVSHYGYMASLDDYKIPEEKSLYSRTYEDMRKNPDAYISQYGEQWYEQEFNMAANLYNQERDSNEEFFKIADKQQESNQKLLDENYSYNVLSPSLQKRFQYQNTPEDQQRQELGLVPEAFGKTGFKKLKKFVDDTRKKAREEKADAAGVLLEDQAQTATDIFADVKELTQEDVVQYIQAYEDIVNPPDIATQVGVPRGYFDTEVKKRQSILEESRNLGVDPHMAALAREGLTGDPKRRFTPQETAELKQLGIDPTAAPSAPQEFDAQKSLELAQLGIRQPPTEKKVTAPVKETQLTVLSDYAVLFNKLTGETQGKINLEEIQNIDMETPEGLEQFNSIVERIQPVVDNATPYQRAKATNPDFIDELANATIENLGKSTTEEAQEEFRDIISIGEQVYGRRNFVYPKPDSQDPQDIEFIDIVGEYVFDEYLAENAIEQAEIAKKAGKRGTAGQVAIGSLLGIEKGWKRGFQDLFDIGTGIMGGIAEVLGIGPGSQSELSWEGRMRKIAQRSEDIQQATQKQEDILQATEKYTPIASKIMRIATNIGITALDIATGTVAGKISAASKLPSLATKGAGVISKVAPNAIVKEMFLRTVGTNVGKYDEMGLSAPQALLAAIIDSGASAKIESLGGIASKGGLTGAASGKLLKALMVPIDEMGEELFQALSTGLIETVVAGKPISEVFESESMQGMTNDQIGEVAITVALTSALFGAARAGVNLKNTIKAKNRTDMMKGMVKDLDIVLETLEDENLREPFIQYRDGVQEVLDNVPKEIIAPDEGDTVALTADGEIDVGEIPTLKSVTKEVPTLKATTKPQEAVTAVSPKKPSVTAPKAVTAIETDKNIVTGIPKETRQAAAEVQPVKVGDAKTLTDKQKAKRQIKLEQSRQYAKEYEQETDTLKKADVVKIDPKASLKDTIDNLKRAAVEIEQSIGRLRYTKKPTITTNGLTKSEIQAIGKAFANRQNAARELRKVANQIDARIRKETSKAQTKFQKTLKDEVKRSGLTKTYQSLVDNMNEMFDTRAKKMTPKTKAKLEKIRTAMSVKFGGEDNIPFHIKKTYDRLGKVSIGELTADELDGAMAFLEQAKRDNDVEMRELTLSNNQTYADNVSDIKQTIPTKLPKHSIAERAVNIGQSARSKALKMGTNFRAKVITPIMKGTLTKGKNNMYVIENMLKPLDKMLRSEMGDFKDGKGKKVYDSTLGKGLAKWELLSTYGVSMDVDGFKALSEQYDPKQLQKFRDTFEKNYPELHKGYNLIREVFDYYTDQVNKTYKHVNGSDLVTEKMQRDNPFYFPLSKEGHFYKAPTEDGATSTKINPTFTLARTGGGDIKLSNPLWTAHAYHNQANNYVSYASAIFDSNLLLQSEPVMKAFKEMGVDKNQKVIEEKFWREYLTRVAKGDRVINEVDLAITRVLKKGVALSKLGMTPTVPLKQMASYPGAMMHIKPQYLFARGNFVKAAATLLSPKKRAAFFEEMPDMYDRVMQGYSLMEAANIKGKVFNARAIRYVDALTVTAIYHAAKSQAKKTGENVSDLYHNALWDTQPMYDVPFRSEVQKSEFGRWVMMFSTQQYQQQNMARQSAQSITQGRQMIKDGNVTEGKKLRAAGRRGLVGTTFNILFFAGLNYGLGRTLFGRGEDEEKILDQGIKSLLGTASPMLSRMASATLTTVAKRLGLDINLGKYDMNVPIIDLINDAFGGIEQAVIENDKTLYGKIIDVATPFAEIFGIPAKNAERWITKGMEQIFPDFEYQEWKEVEGKTEQIREYVLKADNYPTELPTAKTEIYNMTWDIVKDGEITKEERKMLPRLEKVASDIGDMNFKTKVSYMTNSLEGKAEKQIREENPRWTDEQVEKAIKDLGFKKFSTQFYRKELPRLGR